MLLVILLISAILCISSFGIATWARYRSVTGGNIETQIAKWSFKVNGEEEKFATIDLADTIDFAHVTTDKIAPGTYGAFDLDIDGRGSEVSLDYYIDINITDKPTNLKFYSDNTYLTPITITSDNKLYLDGELVLTGTMQETRTIYWKWDYRTEDLPSTSVLQGYYSNIEGLELLVEEYNDNATTQVRKQELALKINDKIDTYEQGGDVILQVSVKGVQKYTGDTTIRKAYIISSTSEEYGEDDEVTFALEFTESVFADTNQTQITSSNAPVVTVDFEDISTANNPVAKIASLMNTQIILAEGSGKQATFVSVERNKLTYKYIIQSGDNGNLKIDSIVGNVYTRSGELLNLGEASTPVFSGDTIIASTITGPQITVAGQTVTLTPENVADYYGKVVTNYSNSATWRLFYVDFDGDFGEEGKIYLKADQVTTTSLSTGTPTTAALNKMKQMNPDWAKKDGTANNDNEKAAANLCDENNNTWKNYKNSSYADYVMGAPSIEMWVKSYNAYHSKKGTSGYSKVNCKWFSSSVSGYKYALGTSVTDGSYVYYTNSNILKADEKNNMYVKSGQYWWLASPSAFNANHVCRVCGDDFALYTNACGYARGVCPLVSLRSDFTPQIAN